MFAPSVYCYIYTRPDGTNTRPLAYPFVQPRMSLFPLLEVSQGPKTSPGFCSHFLQFLDEPLPDSFLSIIINNNS